MDIIKTGNALQEALKDYRDKGQSVGFVPTMGALHEGHLSLVKLCKSENDVTVVSVFVNPTQFNDPKDLEKYPRMPEQDADMLQREKVDFLYMPEVEDVYPDNNMYDFNLAGLDEIMEGEFRSGHFKGVADVVYRLFTLVRPDSAYFGEKDFQQPKIIQQMVVVSDVNVNVKSGAIVREDDGLAMSSRNMRLTAEQRQIAPNIYKEMQAFDFSEWIDDPSGAEKNLSEKFDVYEHLKTEYVSIVEDKAMNFPHELLPQTAYRLCVAVWCGDVRLIDNLKFVISNNY